MKVILLLSIIFLGAQAQEKQPDNFSLDNEEWVWTAGNKAAGSGTVWHFFKDNTFTATHWYSGGAYWTHKYQGTYHYDESKKTVYLQYKKDKLLPVVTTNLCIQLVDDLTGGYYPIFYNSWKKQNNKYVAFGVPQVKKPKAVIKNDNIIDTNLTESFTRKKIPVDKLK
nr:hypothetical protein [Pedobacter sp. ASV2]